MSDTANMNDVVALLEQVSANDFNTGRPLVLHRGQIGTIVMTYPDGACEVEFADLDGPRVRNFIHPSRETDGSPQRS
jgi:uncharacterized protein DUF4926